MNKITNNWVDGMNEWWEKCVESNSMFDYLLRGYDPTGLTAPKVKMSERQFDRKMRLCICGCHRISGVWNGIDEQGKLAVEAAEKHADNPEENKLLDTEHIVSLPSIRKGVNYTRTMVHYFQRWVERYKNGIVCNIIRDVFGHVNENIKEMLPKGKKYRMLCGGCGKDELKPLKKDSYPVLLSACLKCGWQGPPWDVPDGNSVVKRERCPWFTNNVIHLAEYVYDNINDEKAFGILADALEEAGCDSNDNGIGELIINHLKDINGIHVKGCWVLDLILNK